MGSWQGWTTATALFVFGWLTLGAWNTAFAVADSDARFVDELPAPVHPAEPLALPSVPSSAAPATDTPERPTLDFAAVARSDRYCVFAQNGRVTIEALAQAERVHAFTRAWLRMRDRPPQRRVSIYLCTSLGERRAAERVLYWPKPPPARTWRLLGSYYSHKRAEIFVVGYGRSRRRTVAHEVAHHVVGEFAPRCPTFLNEGIAGYIGKWHSGVEPSPRKLAYESRRLRELGPLSLRNLLEASYDEFHGVNARHHYTLARLLVETLADKQDPKVAGLLPGYIESFDAYRHRWHRHPWYTLKAHYDTGYVEAAWLKRVADLVEANE